MAGCFSEGDLQGLLTLGTQVLLGARGGLGAKGEVSGWLVGWVCEGGVRCVRYLCFNGDTVIILVFQYDDG